MKKVILRTREGKDWLFEDLSPLSKDELRRLKRGESITYNGKTFIPGSQVGVWVEETKSLALNPLAKLDREIRHGN